jgi:hypothetical protein
MDWQNRVDLERAVERTGRGPAKTIADLCTHISGKWNGLSAVMVGHPYRTNGAVAGTLHLRFVKHQNDTVRWDQRIQP